MKPKSLKKGKRGNLNRKLLITIYRKLKERATDLLRRSSLKKKRKEKSRNSERCKRKLKIGSLRLTPSELKGLLKRGKELQETKREESLRRDRGSYRIWR